MNSRVSTRGLGSQLRISQQSASYLIQSLVRRGILQDYVCIADPALLGLINVFVLYDYSNFDGKKLATMKGKLSKNPDVVAVEEVSQGADLLVEFSVPNLSHFNKRHTELLYEFKQTLQVSKIYVVIVKHLYGKKFLGKVQERHEFVLCGDRSVLPINETQLGVLRVLNSSPREPIVGIARELSIDSKTVTRIKRQLEQEQIIRGYSITINNEAAQIMREYLFIRTDFDKPKDFSRLLEFALIHKNIVEAIKIIGDFDMVLIIEQNGFGDVIRELRKSFKIKDYKLIKSDKIIKQKYLPLRLWMKTQ